MPGKLDEISRTIGAIETAIGELRRRADEDREIRDRWHAENRAAIATLTQKLDHHAGAVEMLRPAVAALEVSRSRLVALASLGFAGVVCTMTASGKTFRLRNRPARARTSGTVCAFGKRATAGRRGGRSGSAP